ncbi:hypothetical protein [Burkholderia gladioli]|uniref:hypothetical protein n=1 Tax=Burkholderia gladioli TaxID=28095 RepID=UPI00163F6AD9|nr:hypothetical protein [Burkholderia gladioli]MBU9380628.1 hypothetical protein [Burkholderia gladioli]MDN7494815.1 hypothetical protein [Burkholderia gladioli]
MTDSTPARERVEARLRAGDRRFKQLEARIDASDQQVKEHLSQQDEHLRRQDEKIDVLVAAVEKIQTNTQSMVDTWDGGARVVRTMCRLAEAWRFAVRHVALPAMGVGTVGLIVVRYMRHEPIPDWAAAVVKVLIG